MLMDEWCLRHTGKNYDAQGEWAKKGMVIHSLLAAMMNEDFFYALRQKVRDGISLTGSGLKKVIALYT